MTFGDVKRSPMLNSFIREFEVDPDQAIQELRQQTGVGANDSTIIGRLLCMMHEPVRTKVGDPLSRKSSKKAIHRADYSLIMFHFLVPPIRHALPPIAIPTR